MIKVTQGSKMQLSACTLEAWSTLHIPKQKLAAVYNIIKKQFNLALCLLIIMNIIMNDTNASKLTPAKTSHKDQSKDYSSRRLNKFHRQLNQNSYILNLRKANFKAKKFKVKQIKLKTREMKMRRTHEIWNAYMFTII